jgi:iron complex outermembrane receptor protein
MYPGDFGNDLGGNVFNYFKYDGAALGAWGAVPGNRLLDYTLRHNWLTSSRSAKRPRPCTAWPNSAATAGAATPACARSRRARPRSSTCRAAPSPITGSAFGPYTPTTFKRTYRDYLPSANLKFDVRPDLVVRGAIAKTVARPDYSALGGSVSLNDDALSGSGGNVNLDPVRSTNYDLSAEWYFAPKAMLSAGLFYMDLRFDRRAGHQHRQLLQQQARRSSPITRSRRRTTPAPRTRASN